MDCMSYCGKQFMGQYKNKHYADKKSFVSSGTRPGKEVW